jgi:hypothetical protein
MMPPAESLLATFTPAEVFIKNKRKLEIEST